MCDWIDEAPQDESVQPATTWRIWAEQIINAMSHCKRFRWSPNELRHAAATEIRRQYGLEAAQILLGHAKADTTQLYAERDMQKGIEVARKIG